MCTEMLWMCVLYVSFWYKKRPRTFGCIVYFEVQIDRILCRVRSEQSASCFVLSREKLYVGMVLVCTRACVWM